MMDDDGDGGGGGVETRHALSLHHGGTHRRCSFPRRAWERATVGQVGKLIIFRSLIIFFTFIFLFVIVWHDSGNHD